MAKKQFFAIVDTETTITDKVVDFSAVICDRQGKIHAQCAVLIQNIFGVDTLFYDINSADIWSKASIAKRMGNYNSMLSTGTRMLASVNAVNRWLEKAVGKFDPELTAYNLAFDESKCRNTSIDLSIFSKRFCLWGAAVGNICNTRKYKEFVLNNHLFNTPTKHRNMTYSTTAEAVTGYLNGQFIDEPHTSLEDIIGFELPTLVHLNKKRGWREKIKPYNWKDHQVNQHFGAK